MWAQNSVKAVEKLPVISADNAVINQAFRENVPDNWKYKKGGSAEGTFFQFPIMNKHIAPSKAELGTIILISGREISNKFRVFL